MNIYGCETAEEFRQKTGNTVLGLVYSEDVDTLTKSINNQINGENDIYNVEFRVKDNKGVGKYVNAIGRHVKTKKYGNICFCFINDITESERRKALVENERLKHLEMKRLTDFSVSANKAKNIFMYNVASDIIPSLQTIIRYTNSIQESAGNKEDVLKNVVKAKQSEETLLAYVNDILEIARLESGEIKLDEAASDLTDASKRIYSLIEDSAKKKGIEVEYWEEIFSPYVYQDVRHTVDCVLNILQNAVKYTPAGGKIKFWLKQLPSKKKNECYVDFYCQDTGIGMSEEFIPYACKSFTREANEVNARIASSGLGLSLVQNLMLLMHGTIEIQSTKNKGTLVHISQPHRLAKQEDVANETTLMEAKKF
jgi:signal transduction histidine kinase